MYEINSVRRAHRKVYARGRDDVITVALDSRSSCDRLRRALHCTRASLRDALQNGTLQRKKYSARICAATVSHTTTRARRNI